MERDGGGGVVRLLNTYYREYIVMPPSYDTYGLGIVLIAILAPDI